MVTRHNKVGDTVLHTYLRNRMGMAGLASMFQEATGGGMPSFENNIDHCRRMSDICEEHYRADIILLLKINKGLATMRSKYDKLAPFMLAAVQAANTSTIFILLQSYLGERKIIDCDIFMNNIYE
jgi:hypothetical protein